MTLPQSAVSDLLDALRAEELVGHFVRQAATAVRTSRLADEL